MVIRRTESGASVRSMKLALAGLPCISMLLTAAQLIDRRDEDGLDSLIAAHNDVLLQLCRQSSADQSYEVRRDQRLRYSPDARDV
jgi:hypothetical protein